MAPCLSKSKGTPTMSCEECWITMAEDDTSAVRAMVLAKCLRRVVTTRKIAIVICEGVSDAYRKILQANFDQCLTLDLSCGKNGMPLRYYVKMFCWSIPFMRKCVYLDYGTMVLKNCDELFDFPGTSALLNTGTGSLETSVLIFEPSFDDYLDLRDWLQNRKIHNSDDAHLEKEFGQWIMKRNRFSSLPLVYNLEMNLTTGVATWNESDLRLIRFNGFHPMELMVKNGKYEKELNILEKAVLRYWQDTYFQDVIKNPSQISHAPKTNQFALPGITQAVLDSNKEPIAIIGISCRFPEANSLDEYWDILANGKDCIRKLPADRWPTATAEEHREVQAGFLKCPVDEFDGKFFGISPAELTHTDPQQRFLLEVSWEALENAGINPQSLSGTNTGVFVGTWTQDYRDLIKGTQGAAEFSDFHRTYMGNSLGGTSGRLSFLLGLTGPNIASESGCSSGMVAVYLACENLRKGRSDIALAAGANLILHPFSKRHMINVASPDGRCKTFDEKADGFGRGEGVATLVLKRYSDALKAGDNVLALIRGCGISQEGTSRSFGTPTKEVQEIAMQTALEDACVSPSEISYVEAHGTGTVIGDSTEMAGISKVYCKERETPLLVASGKTNIGHTESCSGFAGIIKVILSMQNEIIPPHINLEKLNPHINLNNVPIQIPTAPVKWERSSKPRIAGVSSFGITGTNTHVILQEPPKYKIPRLEISTEDRPLHLVTFSAKSENSLQDVLESYTKFIDRGEPQPSLADFAYSCNTGRAHFSTRVALCAASIPELKQKLSTATKQIAHVPDTRPKICFLFTGQGSQYEGMAKSLYESSPIFKMNFDKCNNILQSKHDVSITKALWSQGSNLLDRSLYSQVSIFCVEYCIMKLWESWGICPDVVVGHSLGEFAAAVCSGILAFEDALELVAVRSRLIEEEAPSGKMIAVKADKSTVDTRLQEFFKENPDLWLDFAACNSKDQTVLAGSPGAIEAFAEKCKEENNNGLKTHILPAHNAFHSRDMDIILEKYKEVAANVTFSQPRCTYISGVTGKVLQEDEMSADYWIRHTRDPVNFIEASKSVYENGCRLFLEVGPQPVLCAMVLGNNTESDEPMTFLPSLRKKENEWTTLLTSVSKLYQLGFNIDWARFDQFYNRKKVPLPTYPFSRKKHWYEEKGSKQDIVFNTKSIHPLLGCQIPNATSNSIFQSSVELEKVPYLKDHVIGGHIVFPVAGYMELCFTAGCLSTSGQLELVNPMSIENLTVEAPLGITADGNNCNFQTIVSRGESEDKISIYTRNSNKFIRHAVASFIPLQVNYRLHEELPELSAIKSRCQLPIETDNFYEKLHAVGLEFGASFRSLGRVWKNSKTCEILTEIQLHDSNNNYMSHPVILDALIQTIMIGIERENDLSLYVPVVIGKIIIFARSDSQQYFAHCAWEENQSPELRSATLYDHEGRIMAIISGVQMIETKAEVIAKSLSSQALEMPMMYEEVWRSRGQGPFKNRADLEVVIGDYIYSESFTNEMAICNHMTDTSLKIVANRRRMVYLYIVKALYDLGWSPQLNEEFTPREMISKLNIQPNFSRLINRYLHILREEGILEGVRQELFEVVQLPPPLSVISETLQECIQFVTNEAEETGDCQVAIGCGEQLAHFLSGKMSALQFLFPEEKTTISAEKFYHESITVTAAHMAVKATLGKVLEKYNSVPEEQLGVLRILEVGAGTGSTTKRILQIIDEFKPKFHYTYTDISPAFFLKAEPMFESYAKKIQYKVLNIETDPLTQGFSPNHYDIIIASNVLHATQDLSVSMQNVRTLLKDQDGLLIMVETLQPIREYDIVWGLLDSYWRFTDRDLYPMVSATGWKRIFQSAGFSRFNSLPCFGGQVGVLLAGVQEKINPPLNLPLSDNWWLVFSDKTAFPKYLRAQFERVGRRLIVVNKALEYNFNPDRYQFDVRPGEKSDFVSIFKMIDESKLKIEGISYLWELDDTEKDPLNIARGFLFLAQILLSDFKGLPKFMMVTEGMAPVGDETALDVGPATLLGMLRSFRTEHYNMHVRSIDLDPDETDMNLKYAELFSEFWNDDHEYQIAYRQRSRTVCRLTQSRDFATPLSLPNSQRFSLILPATKNIADLRFCPNGKPTLTGNEIDVHVKATGLNFRDVFVVLKPEKQFDSMNCLGLEFAGVIVGVGPNVKNLKIGDRVIGCQFLDGALPSHVQIDEDLVFKMPKGLTFGEAATLPAAFATSIFCLALIARLKKDETILIHAASGGVGLCAIQVAHALGAKIIATAGSRRKRAYLRNLGIKHVFHSRNTDYCQQILDLTQGKGVEVILNSLTSPGFKEASLKVCAQNGRFVEMSKLHIWSVDEVKALRNDVQYTIADLAALDKPTWQSFWVSAGEYLQKDSLKPLAYVRFDAQSIREALTYMQKAKHIGKIIVQMPEMVMNDSRWVPEIKLFNEESTYLITGGLGGIGLQVTNWLCKNGAKNIVLTSRRAPDENAQKVMKELQSKGINVIALSTDVGDYAQVAELFKTLKDPKFNLPKLNGIFHAAGTLSDATLVNQTIETFQTAFQGKVYGAYNLHQLSKEYQLEHFMLFSSIVSLLGPIGLSNYAAANAYLDALCHHRYQIGLKAQVINWGQWSEVGTAKDISMPAIIPFTPAQGILALDTIIKSQKTQVAAVDVDFAFVRKLTSNVGTYLEELKVLKGNQGAAFNVKIGNFWEDFNGCQTEEEKGGVIKSYVSTILRQILKFDDDETIDENQNFSEMGMDSLMMLEMKNFLQTMLGKNITINVSEMAELTTVNKLASHVLVLIRKSGEDTTCTTEEELSYKHFSPELRTMLEQDMILPDTIRGDGDPCKVAEIETVLMTGSTGKLGPYMLEAICKRPVKKIYCLIRAATDSAARDRLDKSLKEKGLPSSKQLGKIECVAGDISDSLFGLSAESYERLASGVDAVVHCAVKGNLMDPYVKSEEIASGNSSSSSLRTINVIGTKNVLEFAGKGKTKRVLHASTLLACQTLTDDDLLLEDWCSPQDVFEMPNIGYPVSKFVCEALAHEAVERGIPVQAHRFPGLLGDKNGCFSFPNNHAMLRLLGFCKLGALPSIPVPLQLLDVDFAAEISCQLFFNESASSGIYNLTNPKMNVLQDFPELAKDFDFHIDVVEYEEFFDKLSKDNEELASVFPYREVDLEDGRYVDLTFSPVAMQCWSKNPDQFFISHKVMDIIPNYNEIVLSPIEILRRDMHFARANGIFSKMKLS